MKYRYAFMLLGMNMGLLAMDWDGGMFLGPMHDRLRRSEKGISYTQTPLIDAIKKNNLSLVINLLENGANPNENDSNSCSPLRFSIDRYLPDFASVLLKKGANPNASERLTELEYAIWS